MFTNKQHDKYNCILLENITNKIPEQMKTNTLMEYKTLCSNIQSIKLKISNDTNDIIDNIIYNKIQKRKYILYYGDSPVFEFFINANISINAINNEITLYPIIHNEIIIIKYTSNMYHINLINIQQHSYNFKYNKQIYAFIYNIPPLNTSNNNMFNYLCFINTNCVIYALTITNTSSSMNNTLHHYKLTTLSISHLQLTEFNIKSKNTSMCIYTQSNILIIITKSKVLLFYYNSYFSTLTSTIDISFSINPYPLSIKTSHTNMICCFISNEHFIYQIKPTYISNEKNNLSLFSDISLNFSNDKYNECLYLIKIIILYEHQAVHKTISEIASDAKIKNIFEEYDIIVSIENLMQVLNKENVVFFLNYNLSSYKLHVMMVYCFVMSSYALICKIYKLLNDSNGSEKTDGNGVVKGGDCGGGWKSNSLVFKVFVCNFYKEYLGDLIGEDAVGNVIKKVNNVLECGC